MLRTLLQTLWSGSGQRKNKQKASKRQRPLLRTSCWGGRLMLGQLEDRTLLSITLVGNAPAWIEEGPHPIAGYRGVGPTTQTSIGAIESAAVEQVGGGYVVYAGTANGGIWRCINIVDDMFQPQSNPGSVDPSTTAWVPLTDNEPSLATSSMALDPKDQSGNALWAGTGQVSSYNEGGPEVGLLKTTDGGNTWTVLGSQALSGQQILRVLPTTQTDTQSGPGHGGQIVLVATYQGGIYYSGDGGQTFVSPFGTNVPVEAGGATDIVKDPNAPNIFYAAIAGLGVYESTDYGFDWQTTPLAGSPRDTNMRLAVATDPSTGHTILWVAAPQTVYRADMGGTATLAPVGPSSYDPINKSVGIEGLSITADPSDSNVAYVAKSGELLLRFTYDPSQSNNGTAALLDSEYLSDLGDYATSLAQQAQQQNNPQLASEYTTDANEYYADYKGLDQNTQSFPHGDFRSLTFLNSNTLLETDDGGIYGLTGFQNQQTDQFSVTNPLFQGSEQSVVLLPAPGWVSLVGGAHASIRDTEFLSVGYDTRSGLIIGGSQDNGTELQEANSLTWNSINGGDGGTSAVDPTTFNNVTEAFDPTLYDFHNGILFGTFENDPGLNKYPTTKGGQVPLASASTPTTTYSGLNKADANTMNSNGKFSASYPFALDSLGFANDTSLANPEPMLYGMTGIYESVDGGNTVTDVSPSATPGGQPGILGYVTSIAYGSLNNGLAAYFVTSGGQIWVRNNPGATFASVLDFTGTGTPLKIAMDPNDYHIAYVLDSNNNVWQLQLLDGGRNTTNGGTVHALWQNITDNLNAVAPQSRLLLPPQEGQISPYSLEVCHPAGSNPVVLVGEMGGIYRRMPTGLGGYFWSKYGSEINGTGFPNVLVSDLHYVPVSPFPSEFGSNGDVLLAGTLGRGAWIVPQASATLEQLATLTIDADPGGPNVIRLVLDSGYNFPVLDVFQNNNSTTPNFQIPLAFVNLIQVNSAPGIATTLIVDESNGAINSEIEFLGGSGHDSLVINDKNDRSVEKITLGTDQVTGVGPGILYSNVNHLQLIGGGGTAGGSTYTLANTDSTVQTTELDTSFGGNSINVTQTAGAVTINDGGSDSVTVGDSNGVQDIKGALTVNGFLDNTSLYLNDKGDGADLSFTINASTITNLAPATITYSEVGKLQITTGKGSDLATVLNTAAPLIFKPPIGPPVFLGTTTTDIDNGDTGGNLVVNVGGTQSELDILDAFLVEVGNGKVQGIQGDLKVNTSIVLSVTLEVNDLKDMVLNNFPTSQVSGIAR